MILAGGTLQPISELRDRLFPQLPRENVCSFSKTAMLPELSRAYLCCIHLIFYCTQKIIDFNSCFLKPRYAIHTA